MTAYLYLGIVFIGLTDPAQRAEALVVRLDSPAAGAYAEAIAGWQQCGPAALPVLQSLLADETRMDRHRDLLDCLVGAGGTSAVPVLERLLRDEKVFWNNLGMNLDEPTKLPTVRVERLAAILHHLAALGYRDPEHLVRDVSDRFRDHPVLCEHGQPVIAAARQILAPE